LAGARRHPALEALETGPDLEQRAVHREVLAGEQAAAAGVVDHPLQEGRGDVAASSRWRFLVKTVGSHTGSSMFRPTKQRKSRL